MKTTKQNSQAKDSAAAEKPARFTESHEQLVAETRSLADQVRSLYASNCKLLAALTLYHRASIAPEGTKQQADLGREAYLARRAAIASVEGRAS